MVCDRAENANQPLEAGLNPYSIGIWSATNCKQVAFNRAWVVLILILLEYGLRHIVTVQIKHSMLVLILILLEYGLRQQDAVSSATVVAVLILILLEYGLRPQIRTSKACSMLVS